MLVAIAASEDLAPSGIRWRQRSLGRHHRDCVALDAAGLLLAEETH